MERKYKIGDITQDGEIIEYSDCTPLSKGPCYIVSPGLHRWEDELRVNPLTIGPGQSINLTVDQAAEISQISKQPSTGSFPPEYLAPATTVEEAVGEDNLTPEQIEWYINPEKFGGTKNDQGKPPLDLLDRDWLNEVAQVLEHGRKTYGKNNWRKGIVFSRLIAAALRHITAFNSGEDQDPETGLLHLAHASACLMFLTSYMKTNRKELDDR